MTPDELQKGLQKLDNRALTLRLYSSSFQTRKAAAKILDERSESDPRLIITALIAAAKEEGYLLAEKRRTDELVESLILNLDQTADLETFLSHTMNWILGNIGNTNIAIHLPEDGVAQLACYMKDTVEGTNAVTSYIGEIMSGGAEHALGVYRPARPYLNCPPSLADQHFASVACPYLGNTCATITAFRATAFSDEDLETLLYLKDPFVYRLSSFIMQLGKNKRQN